MAKFDLMISQFALKRSFGTDDWVEALAKWATIHGRTRGVIDCFGVPCFINKFIDEKSRMTIYQVIWNLEKDPGYALSDQRWFTEISNTLHIIFYLDQDTDEIEIILDREFTDDET